MPGTCVRWTNTLKLCGSSEACGQKPHGAQSWALHMQHSGNLIVSGRRCPTVHPGGPVPQPSGPLPACTHSFSAPWPESQVIPGPLYIRPRGHLAPPLRVLGSGGPGPPCSGSGGPPAEPCRPSGAERTPLSAFPLCHPDNVSVRARQAGLTPACLGPGSPARCWARGRKTLPCPLHGLTPPSARAFPALTTPSFSLRGGKAWCSSCCTCFTF